MEDRMNEIDDYLRANRDAYTREALSRRLIEAGHDPATVEAAWARVAAGDAGAGPPLPGRRPGIGTVLLIIVVVAGYGYVGAFGLFGIAFSASGMSGRPMGPLFTIEIPVYVIAILAGLFVAVRRIWRSPSLGRGASAIGAAFATAVALLIGISGACVVGTLAVTAASNALR
jgi:hypothetical protein